jgi:hypothetical protein
MSTPAQMKRRRFQVRGFVIGTLLSHSFHLARHDRGSDGRCALSSAVVPDVGRRHHDVIGNAQRLTARALPLCLSNVRFGRGSCYPAGTSLALELLYSQHLQ